MTIKFSKYQKNIINFLERELGTDTPYSVSRTSTGHLKVLIKGVQMPLYTGSTPSDIKSFNNFTAEVKRELRKSRNAEFDKLREDSPIRGKRSATNPSNNFESNRVAGCCIKYVRNQIEMYKKQEEAIVMESGNIKKVKTFRLSVINSVLEKTLRERKQKDYIKEADLKKIKCKIEDHLDFWLPNLAHYAELLETVHKFKEVAIEMNKNLNIDEKSVDENVKISAALTVYNDQPVKEIEPKQDGELQAARADLNISVKELLVLSNTDRVTTLRNLDKAQSLDLIESINQAITLNYEEAIDNVILMMKDKGVPVEAIIARMDAAKVA